MLNQESSCQDHRASCSGRKAPAPPCRQRGSAPGCIRIKPSHPAQSLIKQEVPRSDNEYTREDGVAPPPPESLYCASTEDKRRGAVTPLASSAATDVAIAISTEKSTARLDNFRAQSHIKIFNSLDTSLSIQYGRQGSEDEASAI